LIRVQTFMLTTTATISSIPSGVKCSASAQAICEPGRGDLVQVAREVGEPARSQLKVAHDQQ
jgi:hypothetical protein